GPGSARVTQTDPVFTAEVRARRGLRWLRGGPCFVQDRLCPTERSDESFVGPDVWVSIRQIRTEENPDVANLHDQPDDCSAVVWSASVELPNERNDGAPDAPIGVLAQFLT